MAPSTTKPLAHFMHPPHRLTELTANTSYHCDGCKIAGTGTRFTCTICKFNLHDYCAKCPTRWIISTTHHRHELSLFLHRPKVNQTQPCKICHNPVEGLAYQCKGCNFLVHPLCVSTGTKESERIDPEDVVELAANAMSYERVKEDGDRFSFATSNLSSGALQVVLKHQVVMIMGIFLGRLLEALDICWNLVLIKVCKWSCMYVVRLYFGFITL
ncbi:putative chromatin regulator PHD family [Helianthus annuus]|nr:putative chromatin regulator PHD family [Helianthus annuus]